MTWYHAEFLIDNPSVMDGLSTHQRFALMLMAYEANAQGTIRASQADIADTMGAARGSFSSWAPVLEAGGFLLKHGHGRYELGPVFANVQPPQPFRPRRRGTQRE